MFNGDIRKERVAKVITLASQLTVQEMKAVVQELTYLHDSIVIAKDPRWTKDPHWEKEL